jgi:hypothetical protein
MKEASGCELVPLVYEELADRDDPIDQISSAASRCPRRTAGASTTCTVLPDEGVIRTSQARGAPTA